MQLSFSCVYTEAKHSKTFGRLGVVAGTNVSATIGHGRSRTRGAGGGKIPYVFQYITLLANLTSLIVQLEDQNCIPANHRLVSGQHTTDLLSLTQERKGEKESSGDVHAHFFLTSSMTKQVLGWKPPKSFL